MRHTIRPALPERASILYSTPPRESRSFWIYGLPWALALPLNSPDIGTSRWQLVIERYTNFLCIRKGPKCPLVAYLLGFIGLGPPTDTLGRRCPRRRVTSHQYSPAVITPASGNTAVSGSADTKKLSVGGPESGPLLFHCSCSSISIS
jgi:hypothetical protein